MANTPFIDKQPHPSNTDSTELDDPIAATRRIIFEHTGNDLETRLRIAVVAIRGDSEILPKKVWTDLIEDIYAAHTKSVEQRARIDEVQMAYRMVTSPVYQYPSLKAYAPARLKELKAQHTQEGGK